MSDRVRHMLPTEDRSIVVIMEPTLIYPGAKHALFTGFRRQRLRHIANDYILNDKMCTWITWFGQQYSLPVNVWSFLPIDLFDLLTPRIEAICGRYVDEWVTFNSEREARARHRADMTIIDVYDADADRVDRLWQMRGTKVALGGTP